MKGLALQMIDYWNKRRFKALGNRISIHPTARLLRGFGIRFLSATDPKRFVDIGETCILNSTITFESNAGYVSVGNRCYIGANTSIICRNRIQIGNDVTIAWGVTLYDHDSHSKDWQQRQKAVAHFYNNYGSPTCFDRIDWSGVKSEPIIIKDRAWLGFNVVVLKGVTIGEGAIVGACSVVTRNVEPYSIVGGNPAVAIGKVENS